MKKLIITLLLATAASTMAIAQDERTEIQSPHFFYGQPYGAPASNHLIIRDIYALSNNGTTKFADWVAYRLDTAIINGPERTRNWKADPDLTDGETLEKDDYTGAYAALDTDRGHQAPLGSFDGHEHWRETNYLSNITPQKKDLNRGPWKELEGKVRNLVQETLVVHVATGPLYEAEMPTMPGANEPHKVPSGYWKIICVEGANGQIETAAFIFGQDTERKAKILTHLTTIDEVELRTGLDFLWLLPDTQEEALESTNNQDWATQYFHQD